MSHLVKASRSMLGVVFCAGVAPMLASMLHAQAVPVLVSSGSDVGFHLPMRSGSLTYAVSASQTTIFGYNGSSAGGTATSTNVSGDLAYTSISENRPFSLVYSGGFLGSESAQLPSSSFQNLSLSQVFRTRKNTFVVADSVSYLPQSPTVGLSGIAGLGDLGVAPVQVGAYAGPGILTQNESRVTNAVSASDSYSFTGATSVHGTASYDIQRFLGNLDNNPGAGVYGYNSNQYGFGGGVLHRLDARNSIGVDYNFQNFSYGGNASSFRSNGVSAEYIHRFTPQLVFDGMFGPQWSSSRNFSSTYVNLSVVASLTYLAERGSLQLAYSRGTNTGSGVVAGALQDTIGFTGTRRFSRTVSGSAAVNYSRSTSIPNLLTVPFAFDTEIASVQVTKGLGRSFSAYGSYTLENQSSQSAGLTPLVFNGLSQVIGVGITYSPGSTRIGH